MSHTIKPAIYQIDIDRVHTLTDDILQTDEPLTTLNADRRIVAYNNYQRQQGLSDARSYERRLDGVTFGEFKVSVYSSQGTHPHTWTDLFGQTIPDLFVSYPNLVAFISNNKVCYVISAGQGHTLFEQFVDRQFALEVAKRIMTPSVDTTNRREISGAIYGQIHQYRTAQRISSSQTIGTVWSGLGGKITEEVKANRDFIDIFEPTSRAISVDASSSLLIKRSISISKLPLLIDWIEKLLGTDLTAQQKKDFSFMDGLTQVSRRDRAKKDVLNLALATYIYENIGTPENIDLDFSHKSFKAYQDSESYDFGQNHQLRDYIWDSPPSVGEVIAALIDGVNLGNALSSSEVLDTITTVRFYSHQSLSGSTLSGVILDHLHGEVSLGDERYFLVDGTWYQASAEFLQRLTDDFIDALNSSVFDHSDFALTIDAYDIPNDNENEYNKSYILKSGFVVTDKTFIERVELADLIHWDGNNLYIIHNKIGYGASVRDVCSQVSLSMNLLNTISELSESVLHEYYGDIVKSYYSEGQPPSITEDEFIRLLKTTPKEKIIYVIGYIRKTRVVATTLSSIAKYETVKLIEDISRLKFGLKVIHIPRS